MKKLLIAATTIFLTLQTYAQLAAKTLTTGILVLNETYENGEGGADLLINKEKYSYSFTKHGQSRSVNVRNNKNVLVASAIKVVGKTEQYIIGQEFIEQSDNTGKSIQLLSKSHLDKIFSSPKASTLKRDYSFFSPDQRKENYFSFYISADASTSGSVKREAISFSTAMCSGQMCLNSLCECFKQTLCALGQCLDSYVAGEVATCSEEVRQVQACGGYGGKVQVIKKSISRTPITN